MITFNVWCRDEQKDIATIEIPPLTLVSAEAIIEGYEPSAADYALNMDNPKKPAVKDGAQMLCPKCFSPLLLRELEPEKLKGVYIVPGAMETGKG